MMVIIIIVLSYKTRFFICMLVTVRRTLCAIAVRFLPTLSNDGNSEKIGWVYPKAQGTV